MTVPGIITEFRRIGLHWEDIHNHGRHLSANAQDSISFIKRIGTPLKEIAYEKECLRTTDGKKVYHMIPAWMVEEAPGRLPDEYSYLSQGEFDPDDMFGAAKLPVAPAGRDRFRNDLRALQKSMKEAEFALNGGWVHSFIAGILLFFNIYPGAVLHALREKLESDPDTVRIALEFNQPLAESLIDMCPGIQFQVSFAIRRNKSEEYPEITDIYTLDVPKRSLTHRQAASEEEPVIVNIERAPFLLKEAISSQRLPFLGMALAFLGLVLLRESLWWLLLVLPAGYFAADALRAIFTFIREGKPVSLEKAYTLIIEALHRDGVLSSTESGTGAVVPVTQHLIPASGAAPAAGEIKDER